MSDSRYKRYDDEEQFVEDEGWEDLDEFDIDIDNVKVKQRRSKRKTGRADGIAFDGNHRKRDKPRRRPPAHKQIDDF